jgi:hypothetical protein
VARVDLVVGIGAEYKGKPAFNKANKDVLGLTAGVKTLAKAYIGLAGAQKAFRYSTQSIKAFAEDDLAAQKLSRTVENLGLAYESTNVENFVQGLERTFHVADDLLRPAMAKLLQVTQSYTQSKEMLTTALNASAGAGVDLSTTVQDLAQAYVGNLRGLRKYNLGLTQAELATMSYQQIVDKLNATFTGQAALAAETYAFKLNGLTIAAGNAKEVIGQGITDAIIDAFGNGSLDQAVANMEAMAGFGADLARSFGTIAKYSGIGLISGVIGALQKKRNELATKDRPYDPMSGNMPDMRPEALAIIKLRQKADAAAAKRQKELAALAQKQTKAIKEQTALQKAKTLLDKASAVMNMDLIQNTAALMGKVTQDETLRLKLQQAILLGNSAEAGNLAQQLLASQTAAMKLSSTNPLGGFTDALKTALAAVKQLRDELALLGAPKVAIPSPTMPTAVTPEVPKTELNPLGLPSFFGYSGFNMPSFNSTFTTPPQRYDPSMSLGGNSTPGTQFPEIKITLDPKASQLINAEVVKANANGSSSTVNRNGFFNYGG